MTQVSNVASINYSTAFETDKICATLLGSYDASTYNSVLGGFIYQKNIPHNFTRPVFCEALFSSDGNTYIPNGQTSPTVISNIYSDASNLYLLSFFNTGTIFYKIVCTWIDNYDATNPLIQPVFQTPPNSYPVTTFDSRKNYQKLLFNEPIDLSGSGSTDIAHNLGVTPNYKLFFESLPGQVWPAISGGVGDNWLYSGSQAEIFGVVDTVNLALTWDAPGNFRAWYKVYYDS